MNAAQNERIHSENKLLKSTNDSLTGTISSLTKKVAYLEEQIAWFKRQVFGKKSEKIVKDLDNSNIMFLPGFNEWLESQAPQEKEQETKTVEAHTRRKPRRDGKDKISYPEDLPVERIELDIPEEEKVCAETGLSLVKIGEEVSRKLAHKPGSYYVKEYVRPKYAKKDGEGIKAADLPDSIIPKCRVDESFLSEILTKKFTDHLPLYRIADGLSREGIWITRQLLSQWVVRIGKELQPLYELMKKEILESDNIFVDESPVKMLAPGKGKTHQAYMWILAGGKSKDPPNRVYAFKLNRKHENVLDLIGDYGGFLHSDKYGAYETLAAKKKITWCPCFCHIRRKFFEAESGDPKFRKWVLRKIRYLFMLEKVAWNRSEEERLKIRQEKGIPIIDQLISAVKEKLINGRILPKSKFREALGYFTSLIPFLKNYTKDPWARLDNNVAERAVRPLAIGRKNWLFVGSPDGGEAAATILSLIQTCRALKINPRDYLEDVLRRFMSQPFNQLNQLLPASWAKAQNLI